MSSPANGLPPAAVVWKTDSPNQGLFPSPFVIWRSG